MATFDLQRRRLGHAWLAKINAARLVNFVWAKNAAQNLSGVVSQLGNYILFDLVFATITTTATFDALTDAQIDGAVQSAINSTLVSW